MKKLLIGMIGFVFLMLAYSANAAGPGESCAVDADCDDMVYCNGVESCSAEGSVCVAGAPVDCGGQFCDEDSDSCVECLGDLDCTDNATPLCSDAGVCVECIEDLDCADGQVCESGECIEAAACGLFIKPPVLNLGKKGKQSKQMFTIKGIQGEEGFDPYGAIDFGPFEVYRTFVAGGGTILKVQILVPGDVIPEGDFFEVTVGSCTGQVYLKKPPAQEDGKKEKKEKKEKKQKKGKK